ncbi:helicase [Capnocytophaga canimorsus]|uniref:helicase-related protein n=1 Tax=Capnocytophaga canimorsus TaxID=28188 RepID=UPI000D6E829D|nr:helicase-related protein [Capnocytophaga canimorsus]AWL78488.1 helicase [Capnocytophaga canimorsus]MDT9499838.1 helicase [Capnocytophaga canimorsus]
MNNYLIEPRLIFRDTIKKNLIGPGSDVFITDNENEIISDYPLSRYYSGILFPERDMEVSIGEKETNDANAEIEDGDFEIEYSEKENINDDFDEDIDDKSKNVEIEKEYSEANQYFPTNFGLTFCVPKDTETLRVTFNYAKYVQIKPTEAVIEISEKDFRMFSENPYNSVAKYFKYENGLMSLNKEKFEKSDLSVHNYRSRFKENEQQAELIDSVAYKKGELLLGRLWKRVKIEPISIELNLIKTNSDESVEYPLDKAKDDSIVTCFYKKIHETHYGKFIKILLANRLNHPKDKFSFGNELLNSKAIFQGEISVLGATFLPYKQFSEINPFDEELNLINFQYRAEKSFAIGHGCAVDWNDPKNPTELKTTFLPEVDIKNYSNAFRETFPNELKEITELKKLSIWSDLEKSAIIQKLTRFADEYKKWITEQEKTKADDSYQKSLNTILEKQNQTYKRLLKNIDFLNENEVAFKSFLLANTAMYIQMLISNKDLFGKKGIELSEIDKTINYNNLDFFKNHSFNPNYRPFQLAFFLLNLESIINEDSDDRHNIVDLLWFPTGGGKTEAYLAITAFTIISRRILHGKDAEGVSVIMRYTLRLLTAQQFERATKLILSLDFLRRFFKPTDEYFFGEDEISIGMWVGASTTPNSYSEAKSIHKKVFDEITKINNKKSGDYKKENTFPITNCSWCGCNLISQNNLGYFDLGYRATSKTFSTSCLNPACAFNTELPIYFVDDKIYQKPPTLLFATVDKFAMLSRREEGHRLFNSLDENKLPPDLIIQDELHLLSGPLGSITGLYESIVELLSTKGKRKPKIITSTATTRNTKQQVAMLYGNRELNIFPPMGATYDDNFFSYVSTESKRKHIGFMPTGKTALNSQIQVLGNLLLARIELFRYYKEKGNLSQEETIDRENNFWTIVSFYNSLRDVGKVYNKVPAEISDFLKLLHNRYQLNRYIYGFNYFGLASRTKELTSRVESNSIKKLLNELEMPFSLLTKDNYKFVQNTVDLVLASNMFSVGIDIERLNVMLMNGQPKNIAEYIQASSRVGRKDKGIVINLLDANRSRDKSYFENYVSFNNAYYKFVEPLSVTPFTEIALDKVLASLLVCFVRHKQGLYLDKRAKDFTGDYKVLEMFLSERIKNKKQLDYALKKLKFLSEKWTTKEGDLTYKILIKKTSDLDDWILMTSMREIDTNSLIKITHK